MPVDWVQLKQRVADRTGTGTATAATLLFAALRASVVAGSNIASGPGASLDTARGIGLLL
jgi:hypothetical protein